MVIALGSDQGGFELKQEIINHLNERGIDFVDYGSYDTKSVDYPEYAKKVCKSIKDKESNMGILICGTGIGISITANKIPGIRAALCTDCFMAEATRLHNDANMLALGGGVTGKNLALEIVDTFLDTEFSKGENHRRRIGKLEYKE